MPSYVYSIITPSASFSRPANTTSYTANDAVADDTTAGSVTPLEFDLESPRELPNGCGKAFRVRLHKTSTTTTAATFTLFLFDSSPTVAAGDNAAFAITDADVDNLIGSAQIDMSSGAVAGASANLIDFAAISPNIAINKVATARGSRKIYGLLRADDAYAPASGETFTVTLEIEG